MDKYWTHSHMLLLILRCDMRPYTQTRTNTNPADTNTTNPRHRNALSYQLRQSQRRQLAVTIVNEVSVINFRLGLSVRPSFSPHFPRIFPHFPSSHTPLWGSTRLSVLFVSLDIWAASDAREVIRNQETMSR